MEKVLIKRTERIDYYRAGGEVYQKFNGGGEYRLVGPGRLLSELQALPYEGNQKEVKAPRAVKGAVGGRKVKNKADVSVIVKDYRSGMSSREIGKKYGIHFTWVMRLLPEGVVRHKAGRKKINKK